jgi:hypothetical protein
VLDCQGAVLERKASRKVMRTGNMESAPGRTRTCATGSGGPSGLSSPSLGFGRVFLRWRLSPGRLAASGQCHLLDCQFGLPDFRVLSPIGESSAMLSLTRTMLTERLPTRHWDAVTDAIAHVVLATP